MKTRRATWLSDLPTDERRLVERSEQPDWTAPMLATLTEDRFSDPDWIYERKLDGERALAYRLGNSIRLLTRNRKRIGSTYPELVESLCRQACDDYIVDGEIVAFGNGATSFSRLQHRMQITEPEKARRSDIAVYYYLFDVLRLDGQNLENLPLRRRKSLLKGVLTFDEPIRYTPHRNCDGKGFFEQACQRGWEGLIAKRARSKYHHGRSRHWLKFKCTKGQELVIGGFTEPEGGRTGFGSLLVGYYDGGKLRFAGKVGTGYDDSFLERFRKRLDRLARKTSPFDGEVREGDTTWVSPKLVGEFGFTEWTRDGKLRHPRFLGLRRDKDPKKVVREAHDE